MSGGELSGEDRVHNLVGAIYDASLDTQLWPGILNKIGDAIGGPLVVFGIYDPVNGLVTVTSVPGTSRGPLSVLQ